MTWEPHPDLAVEARTWTEIHHGVGVDLVRQEVTE